MICSICWSSAQVLKHIHESMIHITSTIVQKKENFFECGAFIFGLWGFGQTKSAFSDGTNKIVRETEQEFNLGGIPEEAMACNCTANYLGDSIDTRMY